MAKKQSSERSATKSDAIRDVLKQQPRATSKEIKAALEAQGVEASDALINKIKYGRKGGASAGRKRRRGGRSSKVNKAAAIRETLDELGIDVRPRDVIAKLKTRGISVSSAQVSTLRVSMSRRKPAARGVSQAVSMEHLMAAKVLVQRLGGIEVARQALADLAKLIAQ